MKEIKVTCPVCKGSGKLFVRRKLGFLNEYEEVKCTCWSCKGTKEVIFKEIDTQSDLTTIMPE